MNRRDFIERAAAVPSLAAAVATGEAATSGKAVAEAAAKRTFRLKYAPHFGMFRHSAGEDLLDQLRFIADEGFTALEDNGMMRREPELQQQIGATLAKLGMTMGVFVIQTGGNDNDMFTTGKPENPALFVKACEAAVEVARRVNATWMTLVPGNFERSLPIGIQTGHAIDVLKAGADVLAKHDLTMVLEPLSDTPDLFLRTSDQAYAICRAVGSPACKILYDIYHMQRNEGRLVSHIDLAWDEIGYFQIGDVPGRKEPTTGEINYRNLFEHIHTKMQQTSRDFIFGMEHGNAFPGKEGEQRLIDAYVEVDRF